MATILTEMKGGNPATSQPFDVGLGVPELGYCEQCHDILETNGDMVTCSYCGLPYPEHPLSIELAKKEAGQKAPPSPPPVQPVAVEGKRSKK